MGRKAEFRALSALLLGSTMLATGVNAQEASSDSGAIGEIIVTAQKRSENLQKVPISLQALTPEALEQRQVNSFDDYSKMLPSVSYQTYGPGQSQLFFRGISAGADGHPYGALPTAGTYLDEVPLTTIGSMVDFHVYDVARIEALSGPQGTLYGASSLAGTLRVITNKPDPSKVEAGYDLELNAFGKGDMGGVMEGFVNVPLNSRTAVRISGFYQKDGGYIDNVLSTRTYALPHTLSDGVTVVETPTTFSNSAAVKDDFNTAETYGGRLALGIELDDDWTITPSIAAQDQRTRGSFLYDPHAGDLKNNAWIEGGSRDKWYQAALTVSGKVANWDVIYSAGYMRRHLEAQHDYSYYSVYNNYYADYNYFVDTVTGNPIDPSQVLLERQNYRKQTHEFRISSPSGERFQITAGLFYQRQSNDHRADFYIPGAGATPQAVQRVIDKDAVFLNEAKRIDRDYAVFGQADFKITPEITLTGGIRGFKYRNTLYGFSGGTWSLPLPNCPTTYVSGQCITIDKQAKGSGETHKVSLAWQVDPDKMVYATYSTGFRPGGVNRPVGYAPYDPDELSNYEIGWKTTWMDRKLRFNGAVFYEKWTNIHYGLPGLNNVVSYVNAGDARVYGIEADLQYRQGGFSLTGGGSYTDAKLASDFCTTINGVALCNLGLAAPKGTRLPIQPKFKANLVGRYDFPVGNVDAFAQIAMLHQGKTTSRLEQSENDALGGTKGFTTFDVSFGGAINDITFQVFVQNLFDKRGILSRSTECSSLLCYENSSAFPIKPQQFGIKFGQRF